MKVTIKARFLRETAELFKGQYADGSLALALDHGDGHLERLSINLIEHGLVAPEGHVYVKEYAEHEGLPEALVTAGVAELVGEPVEFGPYGTTARLMRVTA